MTDDVRVVSASREVQASAAAIFELIADPARQREWDGNENLAEAVAGQRAHAVGDVFVMTLTTGADRENRIVEFEEARGSHGCRPKWVSDHPAISGGGSCGRLTTTVPR